MAQSNIFLGGFSILVSSHKVCQHAKICPSRITYYDFQSWSLVNKFVIGRQHSKICLSRIIYCEYQTLWRRIGLELSRFFSRATFCLCETGYKVIELKEKYLLSKYLKAKFSCIDHK